MAARDREHLARAIAWCEERGLTKQPGETDNDYRRRTLAWLKENIRKIGRAA